MTNSDPSQLGLTEEIRPTAEELTVNTLDQSGTEFMSSQLGLFLDDSAKRVLIIRFEKSSELVHFKYVKQFLNDFESSQKAPERRTKMLLLLIHKPFVKSSLKQQPPFDSGISFGYPQQDWDYRVIENLTGSNYRRNLAFLERTRAQRLGESANLDIVRDSTMRAVRGVALPDEAMSILSLEFQAASRHEGKSHFFGFVSELIDKQAEGRNLENWESFLFKNRVLFTQINDFRLVLGEFASEEYCSAVRRILLFALESMGLQAFVSFRLLPGAIQDANRERLWREARAAGSKQATQSRQRLLKKLSFLEPWRETGKILKIAKMVGKDEVRDIFERDEGQVVFGRLDEAESAERVRSNLKVQLERVLGKNRFKKVFGKSSVPEQTLWLRDYVKWAFFRESDLDQMRRDFFITQTEDNPLRLKESHRASRPPTIEFGALETRSEPGGLCLVAGLFHLKFRAKPAKNPKRRMKAIAQMLLGLAAHREHFRIMFSMLNCFSGKSGTLRRFVLFVDAQKKPMDALFVYLELERLLLQFFLNQLDHVVLELPTPVLLRFLGDFRRFLVYYYDHGSYFEHLQPDFAERGGTFCDEHLKKKTLEELSDKLELWSFLLEISLRIDRAGFGEDVKNLIACQVSSLVFVHWILNLSSVEQLFQSVDDRAIAGESFYQEILRHQEDVAGFGDVFNLKILGHLVKVFDIYGEDANYFLEALAVVEKESINLKFDYCRPAQHAGQSVREEPRMPALNILDMISQIAGEIQNKSELVRFLSKRIEAPYDRRSARADVLDTNKAIANGVIAKRLSLAELSCVACTVFELGAARQLRPLKNDLIRNLEKAMQSRLPISESLDDSFVDKRLRTSTLRVEDIKGYVDRAIRAKSSRAGQMSLEEFSGICSNILKAKNDSGEVKQDANRARGAYGSLGSRMNIEVDQYIREWDAREDLQKLGKFRGESLKNLVEYYARLQEGQRRLGEMPSLKLITMVRVIVEIRKKVTEETNQMTLDSFTKENEAWEKFEEVLETLQEPGDRGLAPLVRKLIFDCLQEKLDILSNLGSKKSRVWTAIKRLLGVGANCTQRSLKELVAEENLPGLPPIYTEMLDRIDSVAESGEAPKRAEDMNEDQACLGDFLERLGDSSEPNEESPIERLNPRLRSLVLHSLAVLVSLDQRDKFPLLRQFAALRKGKVKKAKKLLGFLNLDYALCRVIGSSKDDRMDVDFYQCRDDRCGECFYAPRDHNVDKCDFCPRPSPKKRSRKTYRAMTAERRNTEILLNPLVRESLVVEREEHLASFRVLAVFRHCVLLGLKSLFPEKFESFFKMAKKLKARKSTENWRTSERYLAGHIENDLNYLKRIYGLRLKPHHLMHKLFARLAANLDEKPGTWKQDKLPQTTSWCLQVLASDLMPPLERRAKQIGQAELDVLGIRNQWHSSENALDNAGRMSVSESRVGEQVFEAGALRNKQKIDQGHVKEALIMGTLGDGFLKEVFGLKAVLTVDSGPADDPAGEKKAEFSIIRRLLLSCLELSRFLNENLEVEFNQDELHDVKLVDCARRRFKIDLRQKWEEFVQNDDQEEPGQGADKGDRLAELFIGFKCDFKVLLKCCSNAQIRGLFPFIAEPARTSRMKNPKEGFRPGGEFRQVSLSRLEALADEDAWSLAMLLIHSELRKKSIVMKLCQSLCDFQNRLIQDYARREGKRTVNIYNYSEDKLDDLISVDGDFAHGSEDSEQLLEFDDLVEELQRHLIKRVIGPLPHVVAEARESIQYRFKSEKDKAKTQLRTLRRRYHEGRLLMQTRREIRKKAGTSQEARLKMFEYMKKILYVLVSRSDVPGGESVSRLMRDFGASAELGDELRVIGQCRVDQVPELYEEIEVEAFEALRNFGELKELNQDIKKGKFLDLKKKVLRELSRQEKKMLERGFRKLVVRLYHVSLNKHKPLGGLAQRHLELFKSDKIIRMEEHCSRAEVNQPQLGGQSGPIN